MLLLRRIVIFFLRCRCFFQFIIARRVAPRVPRRRHDHRKRRIHLHLLLVDFFITVGLFEIGRMARLRRALIVQIVVRAGSRLKLRRRFLLGTELKFWGGLPTVRLFVILNSFARLNFIYFLIGIINTQQNVNLRYLINQLRGQWRRFKWRRLHRLVLHFLKFVDVFELEEFLRLELILNQLITLPFVVNIVTCLLLNLFKNLNFSVIATTTIASFEILIFCDGIIILFWLIMNSRWLLFHLFLNFEILHRCRISAVLCWN